MNSNHYEDLTRINGIGESRQRVLREQLQVRTMSDLAALSVDDIAQVLKQQRTPISPDQIETWLEEARAFARGETTAVEAPMTTSAAEWQPVASFVIEIQTRRNPDGSLSTRTMMSHVESDNNVHWDGVLPEAARLWLRDQADLPDEAPAASASPPAIPVIAQLAHAVASPAPVTAMFLLQNKLSGGGGQFITPFSQPLTGASETRPSASAKPLVFGAEAQERLADIRSRYGSG
ncbi:MAG: helix-hairpin-helix domain-containing protein [Chloroflexota bacterium]|nr:helix-hairpin-helix domain-containing protein [Chloroflexota bacterium]